MAAKRHRRISGKQGIRMWISEYQDVDISAQHAYRRISEYQVARCVERQRDELDIRGTGISKIVHAPNLKNKIGAGSPCTIRCRVYAHSELEKFWSPLEMGCQRCLPCARRGFLTGWRKAERIQREKSETAHAGSRNPKYLVLSFTLGVC